MAAVPGAMAVAVGSSEATARVANAAPKSRAEEVAVLGKQTTLPEVSQGVVGLTVRPPRPQVVPPAVAEDEVEEIEREESRPQAVRILRKRGDEVVVVEEKDTTSEVRRLESTLSIAMKQIKVSIASAMSVFGVGE